MSNSNSENTSTNDWVCDESQALNIRQQTVYALPAVGAFFYLGSLTLLQGIYTTYFGITLTAMASALFIARLFDAVTDPLVGYLSDRIYAHSGSRNLFIISGGLLLIISSYFLYVPVDPEAVNASTQVSISYFLLWYLAFYFSYTLLNIPHLAQGSDFSPDAKAKNSLFGMRAAMGYVGLLLFFVIPLLPGFDTTEFTPETLRWAVMGGVVLMLPALYLYSAFLPKGNKGELIQSRTKVGKKTKITLRQILNNNLY